jgi:hypothetical protein
MESILDSHSGSIASMSSTYDSSIAKHESRITAAENTISGYSSSFSTKSLSVVGTETVTSVIAESIKLYSSKFYDLKTDVIDSLSDLNTSFSSLSSRVDSMNQLNLVDTLKKVYPVGAIYISTASSSPSSLFGFGTWVQIKDALLLGCGTKSAGTTGGSTSITIANLPPHTHPYVDNYRLPTDMNGYPNGSSDESTGKAVNQSYWRGKTSDVISNEETDTAGFGEAYYPPYLAVYMWKRTA